VDDLLDIWSRTHPRATPGSAEAALGLLGRDATAESFVRLAHGRRFVHVATHGFMLDAACAEDAGAMPPVNPLLSSGLAFAGANLRAGRTAADGLLTADRIAGLDLSGSQWVVLSACNSGVGSVVTNEGVLGLRRALQIAGAGTVIMSLWPVDDAATRRWMRALYHARWVDRLGTDACVREASRAFLEEQRRHGEPTDPSLWGAFVAVGDWR
jgi:CHAT domain-containing protein